MAYQPKNYKKFVATAATATLVATAIAPAALADQASTSAFTDVGDRYEEAVEYVVSEGIAIGVSPTQFGVGASITRGDAAIMIATASGLMDETAPASGFSDVPSRGAVAVNSLKAAGVISGVSATKFGWDQSITRGQAAYMLAQAYDLSGGDASDLDFTDVGEDHRFAKEVAALVERNITAGETPTRFGIDSSIKRGDFAIFLHRLAELADPAPTNPEVVSVKATNPTTVVLTGSDLDELAQADVKVVGKTVTGFTPATDGKSIVMTVNSAFVPGQTYTVQATIDGKVENFTFTFAYSAEDAAIATTVIDDDQNEQYIEFSMNGAKADLDYVTNVLGYDVEFQADQAVFVGENGTGVSTTSSTGEIAEDSTAVVINNDFDVQVVLTKDGEVTKSDLSNVRVVNLNATPGIASVELTNLGTTDALTDDFEMNSSTIVLDETAQITGLFSSTGDPIVVSGARTYTSSNQGVALVDANGVIQPLTPGNTTITVTAGNQTYSVAITVTDVERELATAEASTTSLKLARGADRTIDVDAYDQYGDEFAITSTNIVESKTTGSDIVVGDVAADTGALTITAGQTAGTAYKVYLNAVDGTLLETINVAVTSDNTAAAANTKVELATGEADNTVNVDSTLALDINEYTAQDGYVRTVETDLAATASVDGSTVTVGGYVLKIAKPGTASFSVVDGEVYVTGEKVGSTDITISNNNVTLASKLNIVVADNALRVSGIDWAAIETIVSSETVVAEDVLEITEIDLVDDIVEGVTLNTTTTSFVRIEEDGTIYLDGNDDGNFEDDAATDVELGSIELSSSDFTVVNNSYTTVAGDEGTLVFTFENADDQGVFSTTVEVDVPEAPVTTPQ